ESGHLEDAGCEVEYGVDARKLIEEGDEKGQHDRNAQSHRPEPFGAPLQGGRRDDLCRFPLEIRRRCIRLDAAKHSQSVLTFSLTGEQPAWTLRNAEAHKGADD